MPRVLVIEDDREVRETLEFMLEVDSLDVVGAKNGQDAINILKSDRNFNVILTDLVMPEKTGKDVIDFIKGGNIDIPIIVISQHEMISEINSDLVFKALKKPFRIGDILMAIEEAHSQKAAT